MEGAKGGGAGTSSDGRGGSILRRQRVGAARGRAREDSQRAGARWEIAARMGWATAGFSSGMLSLARAVSREEVGGIEGT